MGYEKYSNQLQLSDIIVPGFGNPFTDELIYV